MAEFFIGRQPIFDTELNVKAYELLFRSNKAIGAADFVNADAATSQVIHNAFHEIGIENLVGDKQVFLNLTKKFLLEPDLLEIPSEGVVLEVLEDIETDDDIIAGVKTLSDRGFTMALDDYIFDESFDSLIPYTKVIKVDIQDCDKEKLPEMCISLKNDKQLLLAEKVETVEEFEWLKTLNFDLYQGYFFAKPKTIEGKRIPPNRMTVIQLLAKIHSPDTEQHELVELIQQDVSLSVAALKFVNSPSFGLRNKIDSIHQSVVILGRKTLKNWISLLMLSRVDDKPIELMKTSLIRGRVCQELAKLTLKEDPESFFTVGLLSAVDAVMDAPMPLLLDKMCLSDTLTQAILHNRGSQGKALYTAVAMEQGHVLNLEYESLGIETLGELYQQAITWADQSMSSLS